MRKRNDLQLYETTASRWWDSESRYFRSLRSVGEFYFELLRREWGQLLSGAVALDLGCGGGFMALSLSQLGADVTGVDRSPASIRAARSEADRQGSSSRFICADLLSCPLPTGACDLVVMNDVLEHLEAPERAIQEAGRLLRSGGRLFVNTFDRNRRSGLAVVGVAEGLGLVPRGTHDPRLFVRPEELQQYAGDTDMSLERLVWERPALVQSAVTWTIHLRESRWGFGFSAFFRKVAA